MNFQQKLALHLLLYIALCSPLFAQVVDIPDPNLRAAIVETLNIPHNAPITQGDMNHLTDLVVNSQGIQNLAGLEFATNLEVLFIDDNPIIDLTPLSNLTNLTTLGMWGIATPNINPLRHLVNLTHLDAAGCDIVDISPLSRLINLTSLNLRHNLIISIEPLANLTNLVTLRLNTNLITDLTPLAHLTNLEFLEVFENPISDFSPLDNLTLSNLDADQHCEMPPLPLQPRLTNRTFPSIFAKWSSIGGPPIYTNRPNISGAQNIALHDLRFSVKVFGLRFIERNNEFTVGGDLDEAIRQRDQLLALNPNMIHLVDVGMRAAPLNFFPEDWPGWIRDENGNIFREIEDDGEPETGGLLDFTHPIVQDLIVKQAIAVAKCGLYDGIFFDYWAEDWTVLFGWDGKQWRYFRTLEEELQAREIIVKRIRENTRSNFLIMGNTNDRTIPRTAPYINGGFMETTVPSFHVGIALEENLTRTENSLRWLDTNLREPQINALEGSAIPSQPPDSPDNLRWVRVITTLSLTNSDGYITFIVRHSSGGLWSDGVWYDFWDADLGRPVGEKSQLYDPDISGLYIREFTNGWAVYNHSGSEQNIRLPELTGGVASGLEGTTHTLPDVDGEIYLRVKPVNPADVNGDGAVNILDLVVVAQGLGTNKPEADVNADGVVNVFDLVQVAGAIGGGAAAPSAYSPELSMISAADVERWLAQAQGLGVGDANFQRGIRFLEGLLAVLTPKETTLLPNYPNPFNPETWIPYNLAGEAEVTITIYDTKGKPVRRLSIGNQSAGHYAERGKAAYWDGRNERGEAVANGIYIYQFRAGDYAASRRMVIVK